MNIYVGFVAIMFMCIGLNGENIDIDDERINIVLEEIEELRIGNTKILQQLSDLKVGFREAEQNRDRNNENLQKNKNNMGKEEDDLKNGKLEQHLKSFDNRLKKMENFMTETMKRNKEIIQKLDSQAKEVKTDKKIKENTLPVEMKKEVAERISNEFVTMKKWLTGTVDRLGEMEVQCSSLVKSITRVNEQCFQNINHGIQVQDMEDFKEEVKKNLSRVERNIKNELETLTQEIAQKVRNKLVPEEKALPKQDPTEMVLPTLPTTVKPEFHVNIPCSNKVLTKNPQDCAEVKHKGGATCDGRYVIYPQKTKKAVIALCDMTTMGGGWTVVMQRGKYKNYVTSFDQPWSIYKKGFGRTHQEFWIGNENLHLLTSLPNNNHSQQLLLQIESFSGENINLLFDYIYIEHETNNYKIHIGNVSGDYSDLAKPLSILNDRIFRTKDKNDGIENCAANHRAGWWFAEQCDQLSSILTAPYYSEDDFREPWQGMLWPTWKGELILKSVQMKIRSKEVHNSF